MLRPATAIRVSLRLRAGAAFAGAALLSCVATGCSTTLLESSDAGGQASSAGSSMPVPIAVVDTQWLLNKSKMGQQVNETLNQFMTDRRALIELEQKELRNLESELLRLSGVLNPLAKQQKEEQLRRRMLDYQQKVDDMNQEFQAKRAELLDEFRDYVDGVVQQIAQRQGMVLVVEKGQNTSTRYYKPGLDFSSEVLESLDQSFDQ